MQFKLKHTEKVTTVVLRERRLFVLSKNVEYEIFDTESYQPQQKCCRWILKSIKNGEWREFDDMGETIKVESFNLDVNASPKFRELIDRYLEININDLRNK